MAGGRRYFSLEAANELLPEIVALLEKAREGKRARRKSEADLAAYKKRLSDSGGAFPNWNRLDAYADQAKTSYELMKRAIDRIGDWGVELRDVEAGIVDFPARMRGEMVYLCFRLGEGSVQYWHREAERFGERQRLSEADIAAIDLDPGV